MKRKLITFLNKPNSQSSITTFNYTINVALNRNIPEFEVCHSCLNRLCKMDDFLNTPFLFQSVGYIRSIQN